MLSMLTLFEGRELDLFRFPPCPYTNLDPKVRSGPAVPPVFSLSLPLSASVCVSSLFCVFPCTPCLPLSPPPFNIPPGRLTRTSTPKRAWCLRPPLRTQSCFAFSPSRPCRRPSARPWCGTSGRRTAGCGGPCRRTPRGAGSPCTVVGYSSGGAARCGAVRQSVRSGRSVKSAENNGNIMCPYRCSIQQCGAMRCNAVRCGAMRCGVMRCGAVRQRVNCVRQAGN